MNLEDFTTRKLAMQLVEAFRCRFLNSEGKAQDHDWSDPYRRWGTRQWLWRIWLPSRDTYRKCVRCKYEARMVKGYAPE